jgi:hypothetical protein
LPLLAPVGEAILDYLREGIRMKLSQEVLP